MSVSLTTDFDPADCTILEVGGVSGKVYAINYEEWLKSTVTRDPVTGEISAITLATTGEKATLYNLPRGASVVTTPVSVNNGGKSGFTHTVQMFIPTKDQAIKKELVGMLNYGRVVLIVVLDSTIVAQVFGDGVGLQMTGYEEAANDPSKGGGLDVTFSTPGDVTFENLPPITFFNTDRATTLAALTALQTPVP
jgi:hypothetical protein